MYDDPIAVALSMLDAEAPKKNVALAHEPVDRHHRSYVVPTTQGRRQVVHASAVADALFGQRLELFSVAVREIPRDAQLFIALLAAARDFRRARLCVMDADNAALSVVATFLPDDIMDGVGPRLLSALREVAAIADSLENQIVGVDIE
jgi:hypothetical protein